MSGGNLRPFDASGAFQNPVDSGNVRQLATRGAGAALFSGGAGLGIQIVSTVVLARLLGPKDFGLVTMVTTFSLLFLNFGLNGITEAIVQREDVNRQLASNLFWINVAGSTVLAIGFAAVYIRFIRALTAEQLAEDYTRTAVAKGASTSRVLVRHVGRNVAPTVTVLLGADIATALTGVFFVETVFAIPGLGYTGLSAIENLDYPVITGVIIVAALIAVLANTIVDLLHAALDPRLRRVTGG